MSERVDLKCDIVRWVSREPQPGIVEARFIDAAGTAWVMLDKCVIFTGEVIGPGSTYPRVGYLRCEVLDRRRGASGSELVRVRAIDYPMNDGDIEEFEVDLALLRSSANG